MVSLANRVKWQCERLIVIVNKKSCIISRGFCPVFSAQFLAVSNHDISTKGFKLKNTMFNQNRRDGARSKFQLTISDPDRYLLPHPICHPPGFVRWATIERGRRGPWLAGAQHSDPLTDLATPRITVTITQSPCPSSSLVSVNAGEVKPSRLSKHGLFRTQSMPYRHLHAASAVHHVARQSRSPLKPHCTVPIAHNKTVSKGDK